MNKKWVVTAVISVTAVSLVIACAAARPWTSATPLYTVRMEQASSEMNFLPTEVNRFIYTTEKGFNLNYICSGCFSAQPLEVTSGRTCEGTCIEPTCDNTCPSTCASTCGATCGDTCGFTCDTCASTCDTCDETCDGGPTCYNTCGLCTIIGPTCEPTYCYIETCIPCTC